MLRKIFASEKFLIAFLALNVYLIWLIIYFPYFESTSLWLTQVSVEVFLIYLTTLYTYYYLIPKFLYTQRHFLFILGIVKTLAIQILVITITYYVMSHKSWDFWNGFSSRWVERIFATRLLWIIVAIAIKVYLDQLKVSKQLSEALSKKTQSDMDFLKAQIAPHFLFNSLNAIFFQIDKDNRTARQTLTVFSDLLRYQLYESQREKVLLANEIVYLRKYIDFHKIRIGDKISISFNYPKNIPKIEVHPLLFSPLVENAFKFISQYDTHENFVSVTFEFRHHSIWYRTVNTTLATSPGGGLTTGIGLVNLRKRLELVYPQKHQLETFLKDGVFTTELRLDL